MIKTPGTRHSHSRSHSRSISHADESSFEAGIKVQIHSQDEPPFIDQLGFGVAPGFQTFVSCQEQRVGVVLICALNWSLFFWLVLFIFQLVYLPAPWGSCKSAPPSSDYFKAYSISACRTDCETRYLVENCNCRMVHMPGESLHQLQQLLTFTLHGQYKITSILL